MKTFLIFLILISSNAMAQSTANLPGTTPTGTSQAELPALSLAGLKKSFKILYFSETLGPSIKKWNDNEVEDDGSIKGEPMAMYHSFNVRYLWTQNFNLFMSPRFVTVIGDRNDIRDNADPHVIMMDDWQFGAYYTFYQSPNLNYSQSLTHRAPFSTKSRSENIDSQVEWIHQVTWSLSPALRMLHWTNFRYYAHEKEETDERYRGNVRTILSYTLTDKWFTQLAYEFDIQHRNPKDSSDPKHRDLDFMKRYHSYTSIGIGYSPIPNLSFIPFIRTVDERNIRNETTVVGLWVLGKVL